MEQYDDTFETVDAPPTIKEIEKRLRKLGGTSQCDASDASSAAAHLRRTVQ